MTTLIDHRPTTPSDKIGPSEAVFPAEHPVDIRERVDRTQADGVMFITHADYLALVAKCNRATKSAKDVDAKLHDAVARLDAEIAVARTIPGNQFVNHLTDIIKNLMSAAYDARRMLMPIVRDE